MTLGTRPRAWFVTCAVVGTVGIVLAAPASFDEARADDATEARFHFERGKALALKKKWTDALEHFFESNRLAPNRNAVINIAYCLEALERLDEAFVFFEEFERSPGLSDSDREEVEEALARIVPKIARLRVESEPAGAAVFIDRKALGEFGRTPRTIALKAGKHLLMLELPGYEAHTADVELKTGEETVARVTLRRIVGHVRVESPVTGASIHVDHETGPAAGRAPLDLDLPPGDHTLFARAEGHRTAITRIHVTAGERLAVTLIPEPRPPPAATVRATSTRTGAEVRLDGVPIGFAPMLREDVPTGIHDLSFEAPGHRPWSARVELNEGDRVWVRADLAPITRRRSTRWLAWPIFGLGAASLVTGSVLGGLALKAHTEYRDAMPPTIGMLERGRRLAIGADAAFGVTIVSAATGLIVYLVTRPERPRASSGEVVVEARGLPVTEAGAPPAGGDELAGDDDTMEGTP